MIALWYTVYLLSGFVLELNDKDNRNGIKCNDDIYNIASNL